MNKNHLYIWELKCFIFMFVNENMTHNLQYLQLLEDFFDLPNFYILVLWKSVSFWIFLFWLAEPYTVSQADQEHTVWLR